MTNFEAITKNPETLTAFLRDLPILEGPWDEEFQRNYCAGCGKVSCDDVCHPFRTSLALRYRPFKGLCPGRLPQSKELWTCSRAFSPEIGPVFGKA